MAPAQETRTNTHHRPHGTQGHAPAPCLRAATDLECRRSAAAPIATEQHRASLASATLKPVPRKLPGERSPGLRQQVGLRAVVVFPAAEGFQLLVLDVPIGEQKVAGTIRMPLPERELGHGAT